MKNILYILVFALGSIQAHAQCTPICNAFINFSLDQNGEGVILVDMIDEGSFPNCDFQLQLEMANGSWIGPADSIFVDCAHVGVHTIRLIDQITSNSCWGTISIEDILGVCNNDVGEGNLPLVLNPENGFGFVGSDITLNSTPLSEVNSYLYAVPEDDILSGENIIDFSPSSNQSQIGGVTTLDLVELMKIFEFGVNNPMRAILGDVDESGYLGVNDLFLIRQRILGIINQWPAQNFLYLNTNHQFDSNFDPFDFIGLDLRQYRFSGDTIDQVDLTFGVYAFGDISVVEDSLSAGIQIEDRSNKDKLIIADLYIYADEDMSVPVRLESNLDFKASQISVDLGSLNLIDINHNYGGSEFMYHISSENQLRISYVPNGESLEFDLVLRSSSDLYSSDVLKLSDDFDQQVVSFSSSKDVELVFETVSSLTEVNESNFKIFPNPAMDLFTLEFHDAVTREVRILNINGQVMTQIKNASSRINLSQQELQLTPGLYTVHVKEGSKSYFKKLILH